MDLWISIRSLPLRSETKLLSEFKKDREWARNNTNIFPQHAWSRNHEEISPHLWSVVKGELFIQPWLVVLDVHALCCCVDPHCTQAYKHDLSSQHKAPYRQEPKVPPVEMSLFPLGRHTMSATLWSLPKALRAKALAHSTHSTANALTLAIKIALHWNMLAYSHLGTGEQTLVRSKTCLVKTAVKKTNGNNVCLSVINKDLFYFFTAGNLTMSVNRKVNNEGNNHHKELRNRDRNTTVQRS